jgi:transposase-like protein
MDNPMRAVAKRRLPTELKESVARRYLTTGATLRELAEEVGSSAWSVRDWAKQSQELGTVGRHNKSKRKITSTDKRSPEEKLRLLLQAKGLGEAERGEFLRHEGIHDGDLERWEQEALGGRRGPESSEVQSRRIRELERVTDKKDKRLKEATALLELQKKVQALWADEDDSTPQS